MLLTSHISYFVRIQRSINRVGEGDEIAGFSPNIQAFYRRSQKRTHLENVFFFPSRAYFKYEKRQILQKHKSKRRFKSNHIYRLTQTDKKSVQLSKWKLNWYNTWYIFKKGGVRKLCNSNSTLTELYVCTDFWLIVHSQSYNF